MENDFFNTSASLTNHNYMASMDGFNSQIFSSSMFQSDITADHGNCRQIMHTDPSSYLTYQEEEYPSNCLYAETTLLHSTNAAFNLRQNLMGASLTATSLADLLSTTTSLRENPTTLNNEFSMNQLPSTQTSSTVHPSYLVGSSEEGWMSGRSALSIDYSQGNELSLSLGFSKPSVFGLPNAAADHCSEVSFASMRQVMLRGGGSKNAEEMHCLTRTYGDLFPNREKISLCCGSRYLLLAVQEILLELSSYATEDMEEVDDSLVDTVTEAKMASLRCSMVNEFAAAGSDGLRFCSGENDYENYADLQQQEQSGARRCELMNLLQMVDQRFGHCADQIQNAASPFQAATASGCQLPAQLALITISNFYRNIRRKITHQIASFAQEPNFDFLKEKERSFESSFIQRQWALQQLKRSEHPSWRPQRGLPEKSVSVLRAWMFQNFLHPYPKDNDKQLLALKSGLTRNQAIQFQQVCLKFSLNLTCMLASRVPGSPYKRIRAMEHYILSSSIFSKVQQTFPRIRIFHVSNWFINARVRLWKPMIEEMYAEINRKNRAEEGSSSIRRCH